MTYLKKHSDFLFFLLSVLLFLLGTAIYTYSSYTLGAV